MGGGTLKTILGRGLDSLGLNQKWYVIKKTKGNFFRLAIFTVTRSITFGSVYCQENGTTKSITFFELDFFSLKK